MCIHKFERAQCVPYPMYICRLYCQVKRNKTIISMVLLHNRSFRITPLTPTPTPHLPRTYHFFFLLFITTSSISSLAPASKVGANPVRPPPLTPPRL